jgi:uncharacterized membrane protein
MSRRDHRPRWRDQFPGRKSETHFRWRGKEVSRLENLADGVFAFSVSMLVITTSVPTAFADLMGVMRSFPAFVACFALLMVFWNVHYRFFRRYGLEDMFTRLLNYGILLMVLFSVYPLKFLFSTWLGGASGGFRTLDDLMIVYRLYGGGLAGIWLLFGLLYWHAWRKRFELNLTPVECAYTRLDLGAVAVNVGTCALSITLSFLPVPFWLPGVIYGSLGLTMWLNGAYHGREINRLLGERATEAG